MIILGIILGCALLALGDKVNLVNQSIGQLKDACSLVMTWVGKLIPLLVVVVLVNNIWSGTIGTEILKLWKIIAAYLVITLLILTVYLSIAARKLKIPAKR